MDWQLGFPRSPELTIEVTYFRCSATLRSKFLSMLWATRSAFVRSSCTFSVRGLGLALDGFGPAYSSLNFRRGLRFHSLKIEAPFVKKLLLERNHAIVAMIDGLASLLRWLLESAKRG
jgi:hypothetical protein